MKRCGTGKHGSGAFSPKLARQIPLRFGVVRLIEKLFRAGVFNQFPAVEKRRFVADMVNSELPDEQRLFMNQITTV